MSDTEYGAALKLGKKQYQDAVAKGEYPYLPVLDDVLSYTDIVSTVSLGTMDIPLAKLVGTKTAERSNSFANNFMPLLPERSEFGIKWLNLYNHQVEDGIQDPIVAYEFMNRFYVQEGNKRVSVMKYLGAYSIPGTVTRLIPKRTDDLENRLYYEFLDFYKVSSNCDVWFSKEGRYNELLKLMGLKPDQIWTEEERIYFRSAYGRFAKAFQMAHGDRLKLTEGDAFLVYIEVYGYDNVKGQTEREMYRALMRIWEEIQLANRGNKIELIQDAIEKRKVITFNYYAPNGDSSREIEPYYLIFQWSSWYVWGFCRLRKDFRMFKLNRMDAITLTEKEVEKRDVPMPDLSTERIFPGGIMVKAVFEPSMKWHLIEEFGVDSFQVQPDGTLLFEHKYTDKDSLIAWMLTCRDQVTVLEPEDVREELFHIANNIAKKYGGDQL